MPSLGREDTLKMHYRSCVQCSFDSGAVPLAIHWKTLIIHFVSPLGISILFVVSVAGFCYWRMKTRQNYVVAVTAIPMVAPTTAAENDEMLPPGDIPTG